MNKIMLTALAVLFQGVALFAQVNFSQDLTYEQALASAQKSNKKVFIDFYTTWCGPCKTMDKEVFTDASVGTFMNKEFVNLKVDAEKGEGINLAKKFKVKAYPTFVVLDGAANEVFRMEGANRAALFLENLQKGLDPSSKPEVLAKRYEQGERTPQLINDYALEIMKGGQEEKGFAIVNGYFDQLSAKEKANKENFFLYDRYSLNIDDKKLAYLFANHSDFEATVGAEKVTALRYRFLRNALVPYSNGYYIRNNKYKPEEYQAVLAVYEKAKLPASYGMTSMVKIAEAQNKGNKTEIFNTIEQEFPVLSKNDRFIMMMTMDAFKEDRALADRASALITRNLDEVDPSTVYVVKRILSELKEKGQSIAFRSLSLQEALDMAKKENKKVFVDCFTTWCGPCKWLDDNTFRDKEVVAYFDENFVNIKIDMEKGEGPELGKRFAVKAYPTMFLLDGNGEILHRMQGSKDAGELLKEVRSKS